MIKSKLKFQKENEYIIVRKENHNSIQEQINEFKIYFKENDESDVTKQQFDNLNIKQVAILSYTLIGQLNKKNQKSNAFYSFIEDSMNVASRIKVIKNKDGCNVLIEDKNNEIIVK